ncbi:hypothetical protein [Sunxiuqinia sp. sy24]|uniref:hypothetical protein n=1 Tax=Sunxiuqinia sp. sy24 TaxID=3461495 RepID=UPI0040454D9A
MKNIRLFFDGLIKVIMDEKNHHLLPEHPYKCTGNIWYPEIQDCTDDIFYRLSTMTEDARKIYALEVLRTLEIQLEYDYVDKKEVIEVVKLFDCDSTSYRTISKDEADQKGITGEVYTEEIPLHEHNNKYIDISALHSDIDLFIEEVRRIFQLFSINLRTLAIDNSIEIKYLTDEAVSFFHTRLNNTQRNLLCELLVDSGFIPEDTDKDDFVWAFGGLNGNNLKSKITWLKNKQLLRELLMPLRPLDIKSTVYERFVPLVFINDKGNPIALAKNKPVPSSDSDLIAEIHKKIASC